MVIVCFAPLSLFVFCQVEKRQMFLWGVGEEVAALKGENASAKDQEE